MAPKALFFFCSIRCSVADGGWWSGKSSRDGLPMNFQRLCTRINFAIMIESIAGLAYLQSSAKQTDRQTVQSVGSFPCTFTNLLSVPQKKAKWEQEVVFWLTSALAEHENEWDSLVGVIPLLTSFSIFVSTPMQCES